MTYIGIDPGKKGALAILGDEIEVYPYDKGIYLERLSQLRGEEAICCLEKVGAMPHQGVTSMFTFGTGFGWLQGVLDAYKIPYELVTPQKWKKEFSVTADKNSSIAVCERLFPTVNLIPPRCRVKHDGMAEAALMALFAKRKF